MANQRNAVSRAYKLLIPVEASVRARCPAGARKAEADEIQTHLTKAMEHLGAACLLFERIGDRRPARGLTAKEEARLFDRGVALARGGSL